MAESPGTLVELERSLEKSWLNKLAPEFDKTYMKNLRSFLKRQIEEKKIIYPKGDEFFAALNLTPLDKVKVVIFGQDPYHGPGQAHGLSFSVRNGVRLPPSLQNIFKELQADLGVSLNSNGDLSRWAQQGVLLLNAVLTVEDGRAAAHQGQGWELFTDKVVETLNKNRKNIVYILWGSYAQKKGAFVNREDNLVIESPHPSPLSSYRGFFGSKPFSRANKYLRLHGIDEIDWSLP